MQKGILVALLLFIMTSVYAAEDGQSKPETMADYPPNTSLQDAYDQCTAKSIHNGDLLTVTIQKCDKVIGTAWCKKTGFRDLEQGEALANVVNNIPLDTRCAHVSEQEYQKILKTSQSQ